MRRELLRGGRKEFRRGGGNPEKKLTRLNPEEDKAWVKYFTYYLDEGYAEEEADEKTWKDLQQEFPRLKEFWGVEPEQIGWMRGRAIGERQVEETRTCEICGKDLPRSQMTQLPGGEWLCPEHAKAGLKPGPTKEKLKEVLSHVRAIHSILEKNPEVDAKLPGWKTTFWGWIRMVEYELTQI